MQTDFLQKKPIISNYFRLIQVVAARRPDASGEEEYDQVNSVKGAHNRSSTGSGYLTSQNTMQQGSRNEENFRY